MTDSIFLIIEGEPVGKGRARHVTRYRKDKATGQKKAWMATITPDKTVDYEQMVQAEAVKAMMGKPPIAGPVELRLNLVCSVPASWSKTKRAQALAGEIVPTKKPDIDNVVKAICDALNAIVWHDDVQVVDLVVRKRFGEAPHVEATITPLDLRGSS